MLVLSNKAMRSRGHKAVEAERSLLHPMHLKAQAHTCSHARMRTYPRAIRAALQLAPMATLWPVSLPRGNHPGGRPDTAPRQAVS